MFKESKTRITPDIKILGDSGYQGIKDIHTNSRTPVKKPKGKKLTKRQKLYWTNRQTNRHKHGQTEFVNFNMYNYCMCAEKWVRTKF